MRPCSAASPRRRSTLASEGRARLLAVALKLQALDLPTDARRRLDELRAAIRARSSSPSTPRAASSEPPRVEKLAGSRQALLGLVRSATAADGKAEAAVGAG